MKNYAPWNWLVSQSVIQSLSTSSTPAFLELQGNSLDAYMTEQYLGCTQSKSQPE